MLQNYTTFNIHVSQLHWQEDTLKLQYTVADYMVSHKGKGIVHPRTGNEKTWEGAEE